MLNVASEHFAILNLSSFIRLWWLAVVIVTTLLVLATFAKVVGNHNVESLRKLVPAAELTVRYKFIPRTKLLPVGLAVGKVISVVD